MLSMGHICDENATVTGIAAIDVDAMTTANVTTVGARMLCPRTQERRGSGVLRV